MPYQEPVQCCKSFKRYKLWIDNINFFIFYFDNMVLGSKIYPSSLCVRLTTSFLNDFMIMLISGGLLCFMKMAAVVCG